MQKKHLITSIAAIVGVVMLTAASIATYATANGYSAAKNAAKNIINEDNLTLDMSVGIIVDGREVEKETISQKFDKDGLVKYSERNDNSSRQMSYQDGMDVTLYNGNNPEMLGSEDRMYLYDYTDEQMMDRIWLFSMRDSKEAQSAIRFAELFTDTLVGDLKNNIILTASDDETDTYTMSLDSYQIPELYQAGFEMLVASSSPYGYNVDEMSEAEYYAALERNEWDFGLLFAKDPKISNAEANVTIDKEGRLREVAGSAFFEGTDYFNKAHNVELRMNINVYDYGTTVCDRIDTAKALSAGVQKSGGDDLEELLENTNTNIANLEEIISSKPNDQEKLQDQLSNYRAEAEAIQEKIASAEYIRYKEILDELLYSDLSDEERKELVAEKSSLVAKGVTDWYADYPHTVSAEVTDKYVGDAEIIYEDYENEAASIGVMGEAASVGVIGGADGPTAVVVSN